MKNVHLVRYRFKIREGSPEGTRKTTAERICESFRMKGPPNSVIGKFNYRPTTTSQTGLIDGESEDGDCER